jgi:RND family efflux transporter MFP subunit
MSHLRPLLAALFAFGPLMAAEATRTDRPAGAASEDALSIRAKLSPVRYAFISAEISAKVEKLPFAEGASFPAGAKLVVFEASVHRAQAEKAKAQYESARRIVEAYRRLAAQGSVGQLELVTAEARLAEAKADHDLAQVMLSKCTIVAPFAGRVGELRAREEQFTQPGQPVIEIIDDSSLELEFIAPSANLGWLKVGQVLSVRIDETGKSYPATLTRIAAKVDPISQTIKLAAAIKSEGAGLLAGMTGAVELKRPR